MEKGTVYIGMDLGTFKTSTASSNGDGPSRKLVIALASGPAEGDRTLLRGGVAVFVESELAPLLDDKLLDVADTGTDELRFTLAEQGRA